MDKEETKMFYLHHQKLTLDIDMNSRVLLGFTELQIYFNTIEAQFIRLNVKKADILSVKVNGIKAKYDRYDPCYELCSSEELNKASPNCFHSFKKLFDLAQASGDHGELVILIPPEINLNMHLSPNVTNPSGLSPVPLLVQIEYLVSSPEIGVLFSSNGRETDVQRSSYFYTSNHLGPGDVRCWLPCLDDMHERCTWEMNFIVTQPEADLSKSKLSVIASGELIGQEAHPNDPNRIIYKYYVSFPCPAYLLSFAIGDFENIVFGEMEGYAPQTDTGDKLTFDMSKAVVAYCPKGWKHELKNSSEIVSKAMSFYINNFGSYPFDSFKLIFLETSHSPVSIGAEVAILGLNFLFSEDIIDQAYETRRAIGLALATQWFGVNVVPRLCSDIWLILGLSGFMNSLFLKSHFGINEYRYRLKMDMMRVCQLDSNRPPLCNALMTFPYDPQDVQFMNLKAPIVLYMINKQMVKSGKSHGLFRVIPEIIRATMSGELGVGNSLSTHWFLRCCRKMSKVDFKSFAEQWIYGSGCPKFTFTYSFNRKKMVVEINMVQTTTNDGINQEDKPWLEIVRPTKYFTGYMTACICEADGTPYEHILDIQEPEKKFEVQFNTKYKRIRRNTKRFQLRKQAAAAAEAIVKDQLDVDNAEVDDLFLAEEGNEKEKEEWQIVEWGEDDEESLASATFEWIRMDSDFEWISEITLDQPDHMWAGQLEKDRDVVSQYEAVQALKNLPSAACSTTLLRTVMNSQCYYRVRGEAAHALIYCAKSRLNNIGLYHLLKIFHRKYCCNILTEGEELNRFVLKPNDFSNLSEYFVQKSIILALSQVRDDYNEAPSVVINLILELLKMNDNSSNSYSDNFYISSLIVSVGFIIESKCSSHLNELDAVCASLLEELKRYNTIDRVIPSYHNSVTVSCIQVFTKLSLKRIIPLDLAFFLKYTRYGNYIHVRYAAFDAILLLGGLLHISIFEYVFNTISSDPEPQIRYYLIQKLNRTYALINLRLNDSSQNEDHSDFIDQNYLDLLEEGGYIASNTPVLFPHDEKLRAVAWSKFHHPDIDLRVRNALFTLCKLIPGNSKRENLNFSAFKIRIPMEINESALNLDIQTNGLYESNGVQPHDEAPAEELPEPDWSVYDIQDATFDPVVVEPPFNKPASIDDHKAREPVIAHPNGSKKPSDQLKDIRHQSKPKEHTPFLEKKTKKEPKSHVSNADLKKSSAEITPLFKKQDSKEEIINVDIESIPPPEQNLIEKYKPAPLNNIEYQNLNKHKKRSTLPSPTILSTDTPKSLPETVSHIDDTTKYLSDSGKIPKLKLSSSQLKSNASRHIPHPDRSERKHRTSSQSRHISIDNLKHDFKRHHESSGDVVIDRRKSPKHVRDSLASPTEHHKSFSKQRPESRSDLIDTHRSSSKQCLDNHSDSTDPRRPSSKQRPESRSDIIDPHRLSSKQRSDLVDSHKLSSKQHPKSHSDMIDPHKQSSKQRSQDATDPSTLHNASSKHRGESHTERHKSFSAHQYERSSSSRIDPSCPKKSLIVKLILPKTDDPTNSGRHHNPPSEPSRPPSSHRETPDTSKKFKIKLKLN